MPTGRGASDSLIRQALARLHPQGIPWPASLLYDLVSRSSVFQRHYELVAEDILSHCQPGNLLDVGTGPGWLLVKLHQLRSAAKLTGVDISPAMVAKARQNMKKAGCAEAIEIREAGAQCLPFADGSFDTVVSTGSLHHWKDPVGGLNEVHRVLRPGGHGLIYDLVRRMPEHVRQQAARQYGRLWMTLSWLHSFEEPFYAPEDMEQLAASTRFGRGQTRFVGVLCCLILRKAAADGQTSCQVPDSNRSSQR